jgi:DNA repair exonuclease SbcCD ATPase subunit
MPAAAVALPSETSPELIDFLRRLASMMAGGRNAEMLLQAATTIEALTRRATTAEELLQNLQEEHAKNLELRQVAELAADNLIAEIAQLKAQLAESLQKAEAETTALKGELADTRTQADRDRVTFSEEALRLQAIAQEMQAQLAGANAVIEELRNPDKTIDDSVAVVPVQALRTARDQFIYLAKGFAKSGDLISLTICEVGACAIDKALAGNGEDG